GLFPSDTVRLWLGGEWRESLLIGWELHEESFIKHSRRVAGWLLQSRQAIDAGDKQPAEELNEKALPAGPDATHLLYNKAISFGRQGRKSEAEAAMEELLQRHPDFPMARAGMAQILVRRGQIEEAKALVQPVLTRERLHFTEFAALCMAQIEIYFAEDNREAAPSWLDMWAAADPDNPSLPYWRRRVSSRS